MKNPLLIGVTGGIGSGKSLICKIFQALNVPVYYADDRAKWLMSHDEILKEEIKNNFGEQSYSRDGELNRSYLADQVFNDEAQLRKLNTLVHPAVGRDYALWVDSNSSAPYLIKEAALIFESGSNKALDYIINVTAPAELRIERIMKRDPFRTRQQIVDIINKQLSDDERLERTQMNINNDGQHLIIPQVLAFHRKFISQAH